MPKQWPAESLHRPVDDLHDRERLHVRDRRADDALQRPAQVDPLEELLRPEGVDGLLEGEAGVVVVGERRGRGWSGRCPPRGRRSCTSTPCGGRIVIGPGVASRGVLKRSVRPPSWTVASASARSLPTRTFVPSQNPLPSSTPLEPSPRKRGAIRRLSVVRSEAVGAAGSTPYVATLPSASTVNGRGDERFVRAQADPDVDVEASTRRDHRWFGSRGDARREAFDRQGDGAVERAVALHPQRQLGAGARGEGRGPAPDELEVRRDAHGQPRGARRGRDVAARRRRGDRDVARDQRPAGRRPPRAGAGSSSRTAP